MIRALTGSASNGSSHDHTTKLLVIGAAITAAFCSVFLLEMWESRNRDRDQARLAAENVIAAMSSEIERNLELYSLSLDAVADGLTLPDIDAMPPELRQRVLFDRAATAKDMGSIFVLDRNGTLKLDSTSSFSGTFPPQEFTSAAPGGRSMAITSASAAPSSTRRGISRGPWSVRCA
jgi:hypothetical protein